MPRPSFAPRSSESSLGRNRFLAVRKGDSWARHGIFAESSVDAVARQGLHLSGHASNCIWLGKHLGSSTDGPQLLCGSENQHHGWVIRKSAGFLNVWKTQITATVSMAVIAGEC